MANVDLNNLSAADLAKLLAQARKAEKERKAAAQSLPQFAFLVVLHDGSHVNWAGKAESEEHAKEQAKIYATRNGHAVYDMCRRPLPKARGRKAKES